MFTARHREAVTRERGTSPHAQTRYALSRSYVLYRSYVLLGSPTIEPISEHFSDQVPLGKAQRLDGEAYESPALPLSYSAVRCKLTEHDRGRQARPIERITIEQHIPLSRVRSRAAADVGVVHRRGPNRSVRFRQTDDTPGCCGPAVTNDLLDQFD